MKKLFTLFIAALAAMSMFAQYETWSVVGNHAIMNGTADWAITATENDLTTEDGENYTLSVLGKTLEAGTSYQYKYAKDHAWATSIPQSGNLSLAVTETAVYTIVYSVNISTGENSAVATKTGEAGETTHVYSVAGSSAELFGAVWSETNTNTNMSLNADGLYEFSATSVELSAGTINFKVVEDHAWGVAYPSSNYELTIAQTGTYDVVITFNAATKAVNATATIIEETQPELPSALYLLGDNNGWDSTNPTAMSQLYDGVFFLGNVTFSKDGGNNYFAFTSIASSSDWSEVNANRWGGNSVTLEVASDGTNTTAALVKGTGAQYIVANGSYDITVNMNNMEISIAVAGTGATVLENTSAAQVEKIIRDGKIVIIKNGVEYSVLGARM